MSEQKEAVDGIDVLAEQLGLMSEKAEKSASLYDARYLSTAKHFLLEYRHQIKQLRARVAELEVAQVSQLFFSYCPEGSDFELHNSLEAAKQSAQDSLDYYHGMSSDGWDEEVFNIAYGVVLGDAYITHKRPMDESEKERFGGEEGEIWDIQIADFKDRKGGQS